MSETPAGWYADPEDAAQYRYWDGAAWTDHRAPRTVGASTSDQLVSAGQDLAEGIAGAFRSVGSWVQQNVATGQSSVQASTQSGAAQPTFASVAASCRDEPARQPLSTYVELTLSADDVAQVGALMRSAHQDVTEAGVQLDNEVCRLVPNPWDPADPTGVAVFVGAFMVGRLPADLAAAYCPPLTQLTQRQLVATGTATVYAESGGDADGAATTARVTLSLPDVAAFA